MYKIHCFIGLIIALLSMSFIASAQEKIGLNYQNHIVHPGCIRELIIGLNGDEIVKSINLGDTYFQGCMK